MAGILRSAESDGDTEIALVSELKEKLRGGSIQLCRQGGLCFSAAIWPCDTWTKLTWEFLWHEEMMASPPQMLCGFSSFDVPSSHWWWTDQRSIHRSLDGRNHRKFGSCLMASYSFLRLPIASYGFTLASFGFGFLASSLEQLDFWLVFRSPNDNCSFLGVEEQ